MQSNFQANETTTLYSSPNSHSHVHMNVEKRLEQIERKKQEGKKINKNATILKYIWIH